MKNKHDRTLNTLVQKGYEAIAMDFANSRSYVWADLKIFIDYIKEKDRVLDLGCGNGRLVELFKNKDIKYLGVDSSKNLIERAKQKYPDYDFKIMDALDLDLPAESFEVVISVAVLNHLPSQELHQQYLHNIWQVLKPGGYLLLTNWNLWNIDSKKGLAVFNLEKDILSDEDFVKKYQVEKDDLAEKDVLTVWGNKAILYYYAFDLEEMGLLLKKSVFEVEQNYFSLKGQKTDQSKGANIVTIARKP